MSHTLVNLADKYGGAIHITYHEFETVLVLIWNVTDLIGVDWVHSVEKPYIHRFQFAKDVAHFMKYVLYTIFNVLYGALGTCMEDWSAAGQLAEVQLPLNNFKNHPTGYNYPVCNVFCDNMQKLNGWSRAIRDMDWNFETRCQVTQFAIGPLETRCMVSKWVLKTSMLLILTRWRR